MSLYDLTYGPINIHTTMFKSCKKGHQDYTGEDNTKPAKTIIRYDKPHKMQYPGRFDNDKWYHVTRQYAAKEWNAKISLEMEKRRLNNIEKSANRYAIPRKRKIRFATPSWTTEAMKLTLRQMKNIVKKLNKKHGMNSFSLDHIIPLSGELVSGLHIPENVRIMKTSENNKKGNDFSID